jgi:hypothetical protein
VKVTDDEAKAIRMVKKLKVVIDAEGEAVILERARELGIPLDIVFIRDDNWALGAPERYRDVAYKMWKGSWTHFYLVKEKKLRLIEEYKS